MQASRDHSETSVLVTRPAGRAEALCHLLEQTGVTAIHYPVLEIRLVEDPAPLWRALEQVDIAVFVSVNAVDALRLDPGAASSLHIGCQIAAVGSATAAALEALGFEVAFQPGDGVGSEGLLETMRTVSLEHLEVALFGAAQGRPLLANAFRNRGGRVRPVLAYHREANRDLEPGPLARFISANKRIAVLTSVEGVDALIERTPADARNVLYSSDLVVLSDRVAGCCRDRGFCGRIKITDGICESAVVAAVTNMTI